MYTEALKTMRSMTRRSNNGHEVTVTPVYHSPTHYTWDAIRYPVDPHDTTGTETVIDGTGKTWDDMVPLLSDYLTSHPDDGFWFI